MSTNPALVFQFASGGPVSGVSTLSATFKDPTQGGDAIAVCITCRDVSITSVTDEVGNIYSLAIQETLAVGGDNYVAAIYTCASAQDDESTQDGSTPLTVTVTLSGNSPSFTIGIYEVTNVPPTYILDASCVVGYVDSVGTSTPNIPVTISQPGEVLIACLIASNNPTNYTAIGGWKLNTGINDRAFLNLVAGNFSGPFIAAPCQTDAVSPIAMVMIGIVSSNLVLPQPQSSKQYVAGGLFELRPFGDTTSALASSPNWSNPSISGMALRTHWKDFQPNDQGHYVWGYTDFAMQLAVQNGKAFSVLVEVGLPGTPAWLYTLGVAQFTLSGLGVMPAPWDPIFQNAWGNFLQAFANRYDGVQNLAYVIFIGVGRNGQCDLSQSSTDNTELEAAGGVTTWVTAYLQIAQTYSRVFKQTPFVSNKGAPFFKGISQGWFEASYQCGPLFPGQYGIKENALKPFYYLNQQMAILIEEFTDTNVVGFQEDKPVNSAINVQHELARAVQLGGQFVEMYPQSIALDTGFLAGFNQQLLANAFIRLENLPPPPDFSPGAFNQGGTFLLQTLLNQLFGAGNRTLRDLAGNYYPIQQILQSKNWNLLYAIVYYEPNAKRITYVGAWDTVPLIYINQYVNLPPSGAPLSVMVPPAPPGGIAPDTLQYQGGVAPYLYDVVSPV